ncbi:MAG TPA: translocation/assembly module TamB domain-containing protein [Vicinamibacterales bacterium]|nr:translocation/assembly module TamB domain-containing protein [Vicinamibacterales bacterium]
MFSRLRRIRVLRYAAVGLAATFAILAIAIVVSLRIDLGPSLRALAEREGSNQLRRPIHIGGLSIRIARGRVEVDDFVIEGVSPGDRPFFTARKLSVSLDWSRTFQRRPEFVITSVEMTDWQMLVEKWAKGDSFLRLRRSSSDRPPGPRRFVSTLQYLHAYRGQFAYEDHETPWGILAPNIDINITNSQGYNGDATFHGGLVTIQNYLPMWADFKAHFFIDGSKLHLDRIQMNTDGATSSAVGDLDFDQWPEMTYQVTSRVGFQRMRELFFKNEPWPLTGDGDFAGMFHLYKGGYDLTGDFTSKVAGLYDYRFPELYGSLHWNRKFFEVTNAGSKFSGGDAKFTFGIAPLGEPEKPTGRFEAWYANLDLAQLTDFYELAGVRFAGRASGRNLLEWPMGRFAEHRGDGELTVAPPPGAAIMGPSLAEARAADPDHSRHEWGPFLPVPLVAHLPVGGAVTYKFDPRTVEVSGGTFASEKTHVSFDGRTGWGEESAFRFHVTSADWQESDQVLAGLLTDFGARTGAVAFGGRGEFDGGMTGAFRRPRIEGDFSGEDLRAWDTLWGDGSAHIVVENNYVTVTDGLIRKADSEIRAEGLYSLGYPRRDGGEEINARVRMTGRDMDSLRHAFELDDWPVSGRVSGEFHLTGNYETPLGFGAMTIDDGVAYAEPFQKATAALRFDGRGVRLDNINLAKASGAVTGAAYVGWDGTYSFNVDGRRIPAERIAAFVNPRVQPSGSIDFTAGGSSTFENPRYDVRFRMNSLSVAQEAVGLVTGTLGLRGTEVIGEIEANSDKLALTGTGRISLEAGYDADLTFRFHDTPLDPYVRLFVPRLSEYTTAVASGTIRVGGPLEDTNQLKVEATVDRLEMALFDYGIRIPRPIRLTLDRQVVRVEDLQLVGDQTQLSIGGSISLGDERIALRASGDANLGILQGFMRNVRGAGRATLTAAIDGPLYEPEFSGSAVINDGRVRHFSLPNSLDGINGAIRFDSRGIRLDDITATMGGGRVQFGGRVALDGYLPGDLNVTVRGEDMHLRYPEGIRSTVDADLALRGNVQALTLGGTVRVKQATWTQRMDPGGGLLNFGSGRSAPADLAPTPAASTLPLRFDLEVVVPSSLRVENNLARLVASADLQLRGTYDRPVLLGRAEVDRGEVTFEGRRYVVTRGNIDFTNPSRIEPFFDVEAQTRVRIPGQTYQVIVRAVGTLDRLQPELSSDPPLPAADVLALLFSDVRRSTGAGDAELRALQNPNERQRDILTTRATQLLANPVASEVGRVVEQTFGVDTFQVTPSLIDPYNQSTGRVNPSARVTIGKRISDRVYLTFSRSLSSSLNDQILLL